MVASGAERSIQGRDPVDAKGPNGKRPETYYINTITNNYYQVKRKNGQVSKF